jgi:hypothetical protein
MIQEFVDQYISNQEIVRQKYTARHPGSYGDIVETVLEAITYGNNFDYGTEPDSKKIHLIDDGDYQGTLLYLIPVKQYQPHTYYYVFIGYGSCSGCDTLQAIRDLTGWGDSTPSENQIKQYMDLSLHVVQGIKKIGAWGE